MLLQELVEWEENNHVSSAVITAADGYKLGTVQWEDVNEYVPAFMTEKTWNGWERPVMLRSAVEHMMASAGRSVEFTEDGVKIGGSYADYGHFAPKVTISADFGPEWAGLPAYDFGGLGFCFDRGPDY